MFVRFARFISRYWIGVLVAWIILVIGFKLAAPPWDQITHDGDFAYLPPSMTSVRGEELMNKAFPELTAKSSVVLVVARPGARLSDADKEVAARLAATFTPKDGQNTFTPKNGQKSPIQSVMSYRPDDVVGRKLISPYDPKKGQAVLVVLQLDTELMAVDNMAFIKSVYAKVDEFRRQPDFPAGLQLGVTGSAPVGADMLESMKESIERTEYTTIVLVIAILLIVYRSPGLVLVPLASIAVSYFVSLDLIALVAQWAEHHTDLLATIGRWLGRQQFDFQVFKTTQIFIIVILFGAATDYCLFLIARYREELDRGLESRAALEEALGQTGHALTASAMTTILGLGAMICADFGKYRSGGPTIAMSLIVALAACMTVAPALLRAMGKAVFWPFGVGSAAAGHPQSGSASDKASESRVQGSGSTLADHRAGNGDGPVFADRQRSGEHGARTSAKTETVPVLHPPQQTWMGRFWAMLARQIIAHPGLILVGSFLVLAVPAWHGFNVPVTYDMLAELNPSRESVQGVKLLENHFLIGETGPIVLLADRPGENFDTDEQREKITKLAMELKNFEFVDSRGDKTQPIDHVRCLTNPLGDPLGGRLSASKLAQRIAIARNPETKRQFLSSGEHLGEATRFELVTDFDPFSKKSMDLLDSLDNWLKAKKAQPNSPWHDVEFDFVGTTAQIRDLDAVNRSDTLWVGFYVAVAVLIVLLFLIRRPLISLYLIFTVVFGYLVSLGMTHLFFSWLYGASYQGLDWKLKLFLFVILVAVGEDYNIYLITRVFEEQRRRGRLDGLREAVARTGGIITSCGVIMAGTFGSMATGTLRSMIELGFAMSLGVLLDTFIIRTILVPAYLALLGRWGDGSSREVRGEVSAPHYDPANDLVRSSK
jgi:putative drug exporter of the RND superfamily